MIEVINMHCKHLNKYCYDNDLVLFLMVSTIIPNNTSVFNFYRREL